ncbi:acyltransferase [Crocinitomicaceae bacterium]|nr:acyltransferase [Crocinitomicaceae bacterium]
MRIFSIFKTLYRLLKGPSKYYLKGMNSNIDSLSELVEIGDNFISAPGSIILSHDTSTVTHTGKLRIEKTVIGNNVFLGANAVVLPGIKIGDGSIVGAGSIVTKNVPPGMVVVGNPAKVITSVEKYMNKCEERDVLYSLTSEVLEKHGTGIKMTPKEKSRSIQDLYQQYWRKNSNE